MLNHNQDKIEVVYLADRSEEDTGYELWMKFLRWHLCISLKEDDDSGIWDNITIYKEGTGEDVTDCHFSFREDESSIINPSAVNLFQVMDVLRTNYKLEKEARDASNS